MSLGTFTSLLLRELRYNIVRKLLHGGNQRVDILLVEVRQAVEGVHHQVVDTQVLEAAH